MLKWLKKVFYWIGVGITVVIAVFLGGSPHVPPAKKESLGQTEHEQQKPNAFGRAITAFVSGILFIPNKIISLFTRNSRDI